MSWLITAQGTWSQKTEADKQEKLIDLITWFSQQNHKQVYPYVYDL